MAKYIARRDGETVARMTSVIAKTLTETAQLLDSDLYLPGSDAFLSSSGESEPPVRQFEVLYGLAQEATSLHGEIVGQGADTPSEAIPYIYRFYELTESMTTTPSDQWVQQ